MKPAQRILIAPLDWGLGHASRCVPLIRKYREEGHEVILASYGKSAHFLKSEFPELEHLHLPGIEINYSKQKKQFFSLLFQFPKMLRATSREHVELQKIIEEKKIDLVVSDNRYGLYSKKTGCIFITHQLFIPAGIFSGIVNRINHSYIRKYNKCYVPDFKGEKNLSGKLGHGKHKLKNVEYIGPLSRFQNACEVKKEYKYKYAAILSGPEPHRSILENILIEKLSALSFPTLLVSGNPEEKEIITKNQLTIFPFQNTSELSETFSNTETIIARSGYSTLMDLEVLGKKAILIPTPGQKEQEYLAELHSGKYLVQSQDQVLNGNFSF